MSVFHVDQSTIHKQMAPRAAFWVDRHISLKFAVFVWECDGKKLSLKMNSEQYMNSKVKILGKRVYSLNLRDVAELEILHSRF